jgi:hypothetical protein
MEAPSARKKVIEPIDNNDFEPDINELYQQEMKQETADSTIPKPAVGTTLDAENVNNPISTEDSLASALPPLETINAADIPGVTIGEPTTIKVDPGPSQPETPQSAKVSEPDKAPEAPSGSPPAGDPGQIAL